MDVQAATSACADTGSAHFEVASATQIHSAKIKSFNSFCNQLGGKSFVYTQTEDSLLFDNHSFYVRVVHTLARPIDFPMDARSDMQDRKHSLFLIIYGFFKPKIHEIFSDTHQLQLIKLHHFKLQRFKAKM